MVEAMVNDADTYEILVLVPTILKEGISSLIATGNGTKNLVIGISTQPYYSD